MENKEVQRHTLKRRKKTDGTLEDKYLNKLESYRNRMAKVRLNETPEQYKARLERARDHAANMRRNETPEQRAARLEKARLYKMESRKNETPEQRSKRLESARKQTLKNRLKETPEQREARLERARTYNYQVRHNESPEQRQARLEYTRRYMAQMRRYKIFAGVIDQADKDQWGALQLMNPAIKNSLNAYSVQLHNQTDGFHSQDQSTPSSPDECSQKWPWLNSQESINGTKYGDSEVKTEDAHYNNNTNTNNLNEKALEETAKPNLFLFNSITSDIPPLEHEVEMIMHYKLMNEKQTTHPCPQCSKVYRYQHSLRKHLYEHHIVQ